MKKFLASSADRFFSALPPRLGRKLRLLSHIAIESWEIPPKYLHGDNFMNKIPFDWRERLADTDARSLAEVAEFFRRIGNDLLMWREDRMLRFIVRAECVALDFLSPPTDSPELRAMQRRYHLSGGFESLVAHHGVATLPQTIRSGLRGKAIADLGAYVGNYTIPFLLNYDPAVVYAVEPNCRSTSILRRNLKINKIDVGRCEIFNVAVGAENRLIHFDDRGIRMDVPGSCPVRMSTLDDLLFHRKIPLGLIKADIEGMGADMLAGARQLIARDRPVLALSCYHTPEEFFGQFEFLRREFPFYRISFTALPPGTGWELTMLAIPGDSLK